ncbi:polyketide synthase dehydratase domain-containing protein [bacterium]|nr:polyketide synthase dehydratase domain-containing protein [bacterium]
MLPALAHAIASSHDMVATVPATRWDAADRPSGLDVGVTDRTQYGAFIVGAEVFDDTQFAISHAEAGAMDPQQRVLLEGGYAALHVSSFDKATLSGSGTGVALGIYATEFAQLLAGSPLGGTVYATANSLSIASGRVSFALGLHGPCASFETACSASLVACHSAARALQHSECSTHLAAGVNLILLRASSIGMAIVGMTSVAGRCHTFDRRADGFCRGEGCSAVVVRSGDDRLVVMRGSAVRQDGRSASLTAPNGQAQQGLLRGALQDASVQAQAISLNEAHGTGTALGDPIEAGSLAAALLAERRAGELLACGGIKANLGHVESTAGVSGLLRLAMSVACAEAPPNAQLRALNPHVRSATRGKPSVMPCQRVRGRVASSAPASQSGGVSSFGYSGTIAHAMLAIGSDGSCMALAFGFVLNSSEVLGFGSQGAEAASMAVPARCLQSDARRSTFADRPRPLLAYRRRAFVWCDPPHPFAQRIWPSTDGFIVLHAPAAGSLYAIVSNHCVQGRVMFPGAGYLEMARAAGDAPAVHGVYFLQPLAIEAAGLHIECVVSDGRFEVRSSTAGNFEDATVHCSGATAGGNAWQRIDHASLRAPSHATNVETLYDGSDVGGLQYGPVYRTLVQAWGGVSSASSRLRARSTQEGTRVHPADLDDALCTSGVIASFGGDGETRLPFAVDEALLQGAAGEQWAVRCYCHRMRARSR